MKCPEPSADASDDVDDAHGSLSRLIRRLRHLHRVAPRAFEHHVAAVERIWGTLDWEKLDAEERRALDGARCEVLIRLGMAVRESEVIVQLGAAVPEMARDFAF